MPFPKRFTLTKNDLYRLNILAQAHSKQIYSGKDALRYQEQQTSDAELFRKLQAIVTLELEAEFEVNQISK